MKPSILFIAPRFYFYHTLICERLEKLGYDVTFIEERYYGWKFLLLKSLGSKIFNYFSDKRFFKLLDRYQKRFDKLFVIRGESLSKDIVKLIKKDNPEIKTILYEWDSIKNHDYTPLIPYFDKVYTFDIEDSKKYNLYFKPLFYTDDSIEIRNSNLKREIDLLMVSTYLPERIPYLYSLITYCKKENINFKYYLYITKYTYYKNKLLNPNFLHNLKFHFKPLPKKELIKLYKKSKAVIDVSNDGQTGLSMRIIEMLGAGKEIITTNKYLSQQINTENSKVHLFTGINDLKRYIFVSSCSNEDYFDELYIDHWLETMI